MELKCGAVILAGGRGSRFGGVNKAELSYLGKSFCGRIREEFDRLGMDCFFSAGAYPPPEESGLKVIPDLPVEGEEGPIGPMGGILSCFEQTQCDLLFFVSCDMPLFHRRMAARLLETVDAGNGRPGLADQKRKASAALRAVRPLLPACVERMRGAERLPPDAFSGENFLRSGGNLR